MKKKTMALAFAAALGMLLSTQVMGEGWDAPGMEVFDEEGEWDDYGSDEEFWDESFNIPQDDLADLGDAAQGDYAGEDAGDELLQLSDDEQSVYEGLTGKDVILNHAMEEARNKAQELGSNLLPLPQADPEMISGYLDRMTETVNPTGSDGELIIGSYLQEELEELGYLVSTQEFHEGFMNDDYIDVPGMNILAERIGNSELSDGRYILVTAHYDSKTDPLPDELFANDKTGAAVLLETARILSGIKTADNLCFVFLSGEEDGHYGSKSFAEYLPEDIRPKVDGVICLGRLGYSTDQPYILGTYDGEPGELGENLMAAAVLEADTDIFNISIKDTETPRVFFTSEEMPAVDLFQDVTNIYADQTGYGDEDETEEETGNIEEETEEEQEQAGEEGDWTAAVGDPDPVALAKISNVLARTVSLYMDPTQIYGDSILGEEDEWSEWE